MNKDWWPIARVTRHPGYKENGYPDKPSHDLALGYIPKKFNVTPIPVTDRPIFDRPVEIFGFGPRDRDSSSPSKGQLSRAEVKITAVAQDGFRIEGDRMVTWGDSGGPVLVKEDGKMAVLGVHSCMIDVASMYRANWEIFIGDPQNLQFLREFARRYQTPICGITSSCEDL